MAALAPWMPVPVAPYAVPPPSLASVAVFWDIENTTIPARGLFSSGAAIVRRMRQVFLRYGQIKTIRAYTDMTRLNVDARGGLQSSGVHLIDVPTRRKDAADKMILADLLLWCVDNQPPSTVVLVSGDRDFSYALAKLAQRQYNVVLVVPPQGASPELTLQANEVLEWREGDEILPGAFRHPPQPPLPPPPPPSQPSPSPSPSPPPAHAAAEVPAAPAAATHDAPPAARATPAAANSGSPQQSERKTPPSTAANGRSPSLPRLHTPVLARGGDRKMRGASESDNEEDDGGVGAAVGDGGDDEDPSEIGISSHFAPLLEVVTQLLRSARASGAGAGGRGGGRVREVELAMVGAELRRRSPMWMSELRVSKLKDYVTQAAEAGVIHLRNDGLQNYVSLPSEGQSLEPVAVSRAASGFSDVEGLERQAACLVEAIDSLCDEGILPAKKHVLARMRERGELAPHRSLFVFALSRHLVQTVASASQVDAYFFNPQRPRPLEEQLYDPDANLEESAFSAAEWRALFEYLARHRRIAARGRYPLARVLQREEPAVLGKMLFGRLLCLVQCAASHSGWLRFVGPHVTVAEDLEELALSHPVIGAAAAAAPPPSPRSTSAPAAPSPPSPRAASLAPSPPSPRGTQTHSVHDK